MPRYGDMLEKLLRKQDERYRALAAQMNQQDVGGLADSMEATDLVRSMNELGQRDDQLQGWSQIGSDGIKADKIFGMPFVPIYSNILETDYSSITVAILPNYKHLLIIGAGRTTGTGTANVFLNAEINGDTGSNYNVQDLFAAVSTISTSGTGYYANIYFAVGMLAENGQAAGRNSSFVSYIPHYNSALNKTALTLMGYTNSTNFGVVVTHSQWMNTDPITQLRFWPSADNLLSGLALSVYGLL
jgi:hypothetical protein